MAAKCRASELSNNSLGFSLETLSLCPSSFLETTRMQNSESASAKTLTQVTSPLKATCSRCSLNCRKAVWEHLKRLEYSRYLWNSCTYLMRLMHMPRTTTAFNQIAYLCLPHRVKVCSSTENFDVPARMDRRAGWESKTGKEIEYLQSAAKGVYLERKEASK